MTSEAVAKAVLETPRLRLRPLAAEDAAALHEAYGDPEVMRFWNLATADGIEETRRRIGFSLEANPIWHAAWAVTPRESDRLIGLVNYHHREPWNERLEIGYLMVRAHWRRGFMREALSAFLAHCFGALQTHRVEATVEPANAASRQLLTRLGFREESGPMRDRLKVADGYRDLIMYGLLEPEWARSRGVV